jgi:diaminopimelate decarboxylase
MNGRLPSAIWHDMTPAQWQTLANAHGTPFYLYDADVVRQRIEAVRTALMGRVRIYYAVKANPNLELLRSVQTVADGIDISSAGELSQGRLAGFDPEHMSFAGPAKTQAELEAAIRARVGCISVESMREIDACARVAERLGSKASILLRVNPSTVDRSYGLKMGGRAVQFGIDEEAVAEAGARVRMHASRLDFRGLHCYVGSQCFEPAAVAQSVATALRISRDLERSCGLRCAKINLGGGFGVSHGEESRELDLAALSHELGPLLAEHDAASETRCEFIFELGRYLTAQAGIYVTRVVDSKTSRHKTFVTCDGGLHHHLAAAGTFGAALRSNFPVRNLTRPNASLATCNIAGPSCNPTDLLGVDARVAELREGDLLGVLMSGSYGLTASPLLFLGRPTPVELVRSGGETKVGRRSFEMTEFN